MRGPPPSCRYHGTVSGTSKPWLGLDVGTRRIGIALSNTLNVAQPLMTLERTDPRRDQRSILRLARRHGCAGIVVGNPLHLSGDKSRQTERVHRFVEQLQSLMLEQSQTAAQAAAADPAPKRAILPVHLWDERLSTAEAHAALDATAYNPTQRREVIDQLAAVLILQGWLDAQSGSVTLLPPDP
jgi:putative Holliday junction resolvase